MHIQIAVPVTDDDQAATCRERRAVHGRAGLVTPQHRARHIYGDKFTNAVGSVGMVEMCPTRNTDTAATFHLVWAGTKRRALAADE